MRYVRAQKPEKHNGGAFYEHEIHFEIHDSPHFSNQIRDEITQFIIEKIGDKHTDFRVTALTRYVGGTTQLGKTTAFMPGRVTTVKARFVSRDHAMLFKLSYQSK